MKHPASVSTAPTSASSASPTVKERPVKRKAEFDLSRLEPWREFAVTLYNDEIHTQQEVVIQLMRALECSPARATALMSEAHHRGKAVVAIAGRPRAVRIAGILRQIGLRVSLRQIN